MLENGQELSARYLLVRRLGEGASGSVWLAHDRERDCPVALKVLASEWAREPRAIAALEREFATMRRLDHPNVLRTDGMFRSGEHVWIAMEYADGGNASQLRGAPIGRILQVAIPIASALAHAHRAGVVHRDVKPANVLLMGDGTPKLADFGIAAAIGTRGCSGSPFSMSPQHLAGEPAAASDDVYAFGALLYELLSGYPPFYPDAAPERIRDEMPAALPARVPQKMANLVERLLAKSPAQRPANMADVERELKEQAAAEHNAAQPSAVRIEPPSARAPGAFGEPLRSEWRRTNAPRIDEQQLRREGFRRGLGVAAILLGIVGVLFVFLALPRWVNERQPNARASAPAPVKAAPAEVEKQKELDFAALARAKQEADDLRGPIEERLQKLREQAVEHWGEPELTRASQALAAGDEQYAAREYIAAVEHFKGIPSLLDTLEKRAGQVLQAQLDSGTKALQEGRSADARTAFELAAKIDPQNAAAKRGLQRAATLDEVLGLLASAERAEKEGRAQEALDLFRRALALDAEAPRAPQGIARIEARLAGDAFASAMARGFSALANADHAGARRAFQEAGRIRPNAPEVAQALRQIEQEERTNIIGTKLRAAAALEAQEQWADALKEYRSVLELDPAVAAANEGVARVAPRSALNEQLEMYLTQPERLFSQPVRAAARESLQRAQSIANPGPVLQRQIATLQEWLARAEQPVSVAIESDNQTQVTIYRVGALGTFERRSLELVPGTYTIVGTRPGYRDVRRQINVVPGAPLEPVVIRCEDRI